MPADSVPSPSGAMTAAPQSKWARLAGWIPLGDPFALIGFVIYFGFVLLAIFAGQLATHDPNEILFDANFNLASDLGPGREYLLGTTSLGRDIWSQLVLGTRSALLVGLMAALMVVGIGTLAGLIAGYFGGLTDILLMRLADVAFGIPFLPFVIVLCAFLEPSLWNIVFAMALVLWADTARVIRAQVMTLRTRTFVEAARVAGSSDLRILFVHIAPNIMPLAVLYGSLAVGWAVLTEASISFLGFGDPNAISWGYMLQDAYASQALSRDAYNWFVPPGVAIVLVVAAGFFIGRGYEETLFPKLKA